MLSPDAASNPGVRLAVIYDHDVDGAAEAILALLLRPAKQSESVDQEDEQSARHAA
jgi:hypothetical protein